MPIISTIVALAGVAAAAAGVGEAASASGTASQAANEQNQIAQSQEQINQQSAADQQKVFNQLFPFYSQYLGTGSPFLSNLQSQTASQNAQGYNNAAGNLRQTMQTSGLGYGPSGTTGAALGELGAQEANQSASSYLQNLLNNENLKFNAAQGLTSAGQGVTKTGQNMPTNQVTQTTTGSSVDAFGQALQNLFKQNNGTSATGGANVNAGVTTGPNPSQVPAQIFMDPLSAGTQGTSV